MTNIINDNQNILHSICFADECMFFLRGTNMLGNTIIGPELIEENPTVHFNLITTSSEIQIDGAGNMILQEDVIHFQQDGTSSHYTLAVRQWLNDEFPGKSIE